VPEPVVPRPLPAPEPVPLPVAPPARAPEGFIDAGVAGRLWYRVRGAGRDTILVPLAAYLGDALEPLSAAHVVIAFDPRRRGRSETPADTTLSTFAGVVTDIEAVRADFGVSRAALMGYSELAAAAVAYAATFPDRVSRLVLVSPLEPTPDLARRYQPPDRMARLDTSLARTLVRLRAAGRDTTDAAAYCRAYWQLMAPIYVGDTTWARRVTAPWCELPNESPAALAAHLSRVAATADSTPAPTAALVRAPTLVIHGERNLVASPDGANAWARLVPDARLWLLPGAGHLLFLESGDALQRGLERFLRGEWPDRAVPPRSP
jgi:pimeloyl-ACP methyl ester carboxylesterase